VQSEATTSRYCAQQRLGCLVLLGAMATLSATSSVVVGGGYVPITNSNQRKKKKKGHNL